MKLLILPSNKLLLYLGKLSLAFLPKTFLAEQYVTLPNHPQHIQNITNAQQQPIIALSHYKTVTIYKQTDLIKSADYTHKSPTKPLLQESFTKKVQAIDLYYTNPQTQTHNQLPNIQCIISDKFGDLFKIKLPPPQNTNQQQTKQHIHTPTYVNSNLGIPKYIKHISLHHMTNTFDIKQYLILGDEQNRIKVYNSINPQQLLSVWFIINMFSIECHLLHTNPQNHPIIILLLRYYNKITLQTNIELHYFLASPTNLQAQEYPGIKVKSQLQDTYRSTAKQCRYFTIVKIGDKGLLLLYLYEIKILYEVFLAQYTNNEQNPQIKSKIHGEIAIEQGNWDYLYGIDTQDNNTIILAFGADVEIPQQIQMNNEFQKQNIISLVETNQISVNKFEKIVKLMLPSF